MSACPKCGSPVLPTDKFCNSCGFALASAGPAGPTNPGPGPGPAFGAPPPFGAPPQQAPAPQQPGPPQQQPQQPYGGGGGGGGGGDPQHHQPGAGPYGAPPPPPPAQHGPYGPPPQPFGMEPTAPGGPGGYGPDAYGAPPQHNAPYGQPPHQQAYGQPPQHQYAPQPVQQQQGYAPGPGFGGPPPFGTPPNQAPQPSPGFGYGGPPPQQPGPGAPAPFGAPPGVVQPLSPLTGPPGPIPAGHPQDPNAMVPQPGASNRSLRGFMVAFQANTQGEFWPLYGGRVTLGRANSGEVLDIQLPDPTISSKHAALLVDNVSGAVHVEDTGSTNGTYVNDEHLGFNGRRELRDGDHVRFGGFTTIVKVIGRV